MVEHLVANENVARSNRVTRLFFLSEFVLYLTFIQLRLKCRETTTLWLFRNPECSRFALGLLVLSFLLHKVRGRRAWGCRNVARTGLVAVGLTLVLTLALTR